MKKILFNAIAGLLLSLACTLNALAQDAPADQAAEPEQAAASEPVKREEPDIEALEKQSREAYEAGEYVRYYGANIRMMNQRPYEPIYMKRVIEACALLERRRTAYHYMLKMQQQGLSYDLSEAPDAANIRTTELFDYLNDLMIEAGEPAGSAEPVVSFEREYGQPSALTWDSTREKFLVGTISQGAIVAVAANGSQDVLIRANIDNGLWAIRGLHADAERNRLWVSTSAIPEYSQYSPVDEGRAALFEFELETLKQVNRFNLPMDGLQHDLGTLAITDAGDVYVLDHATSVVYRKAAGGQALEPFVGSTDFNSVSALAVSNDNRRLYIADLYKGVLVVDPIEQSSVLLTGPETLNLGRINSLSFGDKKLYMIQTGIRPERLMQLELDDQGTAATEALPMASALESFDDPGVSIYLNGYVYYFANLGAGPDAPVRLVRTALVTDEGRPDFELDANPGNESGD